MEKTGVNIINDESSAEAVAKLRAMNEAGNVTWDVVDVVASDAIRLCDEGLALEIDVNEQLANGDDDASVSVAKPINASKAGESTGVPILPVWIEFSSNPHLENAHNAAEVTVATGAELQTKVDAIKAKFQPQLDALAEQAEDLTKGLPSNEELIFDIDLDEKELVEWKLHVPEVTMKLQTWKLHIPEVAMKLQTWSFHLPELAMKYVKFPWGGGMHLPTMVMKEHVWKLDIPEVTMKLQTWKLHIPEVTMKIQTLKYHLPRVTIGGPRNELDSRKVEGRAIETEVVQVVKQMKSEIKSVTRVYLTKLRAEIAKRFDTALAEIDLSIKSAPTDDFRRNLSDKRSQITSARAAALSEMDAALAQLG